MLDFGACRGHTINMKTTIDRYFTEADVLEVDGYLIHSWDFDFDVDTDEVSLEFSYSDSEGLIYCFEFTQEQVKDGKILSGGAILLIDSEGNEVMVNCFSLERLIL